MLWVHFNTMRWCDRTILHLVWLCAFVYGNVYLGYTYLSSEILIDSKQWMCGTRTYAEVSTFWTGLLCDNNCSSYQQKICLPLWSNLLYWFNSVCSPTQFLLLDVKCFECFHCMEMKWQRLVFKCNVLLLLFSHGCVHWVVCCMC